MADILTEAAIWNGSAETFKAFAPVIALVLGMILAPIVVDYLVQLFRGSRASSGRGASRRMTRTVDQGARARRSDSEGG